MNYLTVLKKRRAIKRNDDARDRRIAYIPGVHEWKNIVYNKKYGKYGKLDIYKPEEKIYQKLPVLVIVHGGGLYYGTKETYHLYSRYLSFLGVTVVCYSYPLLPKYKFPLQLECLDEVLDFIKREQAKWNFDLNNVFLVGDSAGAALAYNYGIIQSNPNYRMLFNYKNPLPIRGYLLACGSYQDILPGKSKEELSTKELKAITDILGKDFNAFDPRFMPSNYLTKDFGPVYLFTSEKDFLLEENERFFALLSKKKVDVSYRNYMSEEGNVLDHVFHCRLYLPEAKECNLEQIRFVMSHLAH